MNKKITSVPSDYADWLIAIKNRVHAARQRATLAANAELIGLYWQIGRDILQRQTEQGWGAKIIDRLAKDLTMAFPDMRGFSSRNLLYMRAFAEIWPDAVIVQQLAAQLPWFHNVVLITRLKCYEVVELKAIDFKPEHAGQLNFYLTAVDKEIKASDDKPTIGLLLCKTRSRLIAEYALSGIEKPIGVAEFQLVRNLPEQLVPSLPTVEQLENELGAIETDLISGNKEKQ